MKRLKNAALTDRNALKDKRMAVKKMEMLSELQMELSCARMGGRLTWKKLSTAPRLPTMRHART